jgi:hypothetical protein
MPKFVIEKTSGDGNQFEVEASSKIEALRKFLAHTSNLAEVLAEHDSGSDPENVYLNHQTDERWSYLTLNIGTVPEFECEFCGASVDTADGYGHNCEDHNE